MTQRTIIIMRHGEAEGYAQQDSLRNLSLYGKQDVADTASKLKGIIIDTVWASPYNRAQQTAEIVMASLGLDAACKIDHVGITPSGNASVIGEELKAETGNILLATHMPFVSELTAYLTGKLCGFNTADCAIIRISDDGVELEMVASHVR